MYYIDVRSRAIKYYVKLDSVEKHEATNEAKMCYRASGIDKFEMVSAVKDNTYYTAVKQ